MAGGVSESTGTITILPFAVQLPHNRIFSRAYKGDKVSLLS